MSHRIMRVAFIVAVSFASVAAQDFALKLVSTPVTIEADVRELGGILAGGTWRMPSHGGFYCDGLAVDGISFTRNAEPHFDAVVRTFDVVVDLRARPDAQDVMADLEFIVIDGERRLILGKFTGVRVGARDKTSVAETFSMTAYDFESFLTAGHAPTLRVTMTTRDDC